MIKPQNLPNLSLIKTEGILQSSSDTICLTMTKPREMMYLVIVFTSWGRCSSNTDGHFLKQQGHSHLATNEALWANGVDIKKVNWKLSGCFSHHSGIT